jgi:ATPase subunit of ABC transporter with duplicated ATPase domains
MAWDSWEETRRKNDEHRKRVEEERQRREKRLADERQRMADDRQKAKESKKAEAKKKAEREETKRKQIEQSNAMYSEALGGKGPEAKKPTISLNKCGGMGGFGSSGGSAPTIRPGQRVGGMPGPGGGAAMPANASASPAQQATVHSSNRLTSGSVFSGFRR